jgi:5-methylcytosine-specific restriction endonuclease McrA
MGRARERSWPRMPRPNSKKICSLTQMAKARRKEGLLWECLAAHHVGPRMLPRGNFSRNGGGEDHRHSHCRECRREHKSENAARRRGAGVTKMPAGWIRRLWQSQAGRCAICWGAIFGRYHVDHKRPVSRGGQHVFENLQLTHPRCNLAKSNKLK